MPNSIVSKPNIHMRKLCVGIDTVEQLEERVALIAPQRGGVTWHITRSWPKRAAELQAGGSLYWIIKGIMQARQPIAGFEEVAGEGPDDKPRCKILLEPQVIRTQPWPHRPFQGWRYLKPEDTPPDIDAIEDGDDQLPPELAAELRNMGVL